MIPFDPDGSLQRTLYLHSHIHFVQLALNNSRLVIGSRVGTVIIGSNAYFLCFIVTVLPALFSGYGNRAGTEIVLV